MTPHEIARLVDGHGPSLVLFARQWCASPEDVVQEAFLKLIKQRPVPERIIPWLYRVVRNEAIDSAKKDRRRRRRETAAAQSKPWFEESRIEEIDAEAAVTALQSLEMEQREVIILHLWGELTFQEIGEVVACSASTAYRRYQSGIEKLQMELLSWDPSLKSD